MLNMTSDQVGGWVRAALAVYVPWLAAHGVSDWVSTDLIIPTAVAVAVGLWSHYTNRPLPPTT